MKQFSKQIILSMMIIVLSWSATAQVGIGTTTPNASAAFDITSTTQGFLPPRMTAAQRNSISAPVQGLMVFCTNCGTNGEAQLYNGISWVNLVGEPTSTMLNCGNVTFLYNGSTVTYGTVVGANSKCWLDRNLGATQVATSSNDALSYGDLFQWGRRVDGHQSRTSVTQIFLSGVDQPAHGNFITINSGNLDWRSPQNNNLWQGLSGINNPCPSGYRLPTDTELNAERASWSIQNRNGAYASPLKLPATGLRLQDGVIHFASGSGYYWNSSLNGPNARNLYFDSSSASMSTNHRAAGMSVRCIKD